ncbi:MAG: oligosaccharide flippase family protein [Phycisphaerales bacterium]|jgi:O-antigen/teichoic acid export membrane protein|nr:oligosaccharide flippase family protein [Phycisphaerales bacterium]
MSVVTQKPVDLPQSNAPTVAWLSRGIWAVLDQGLFAGSNFVLNVLLAKFLSERDYGAFVTAFSIFLLLGTIHSALLIEPMLVYGPDRYRGRLPAYFNVLTLGHAAMAILASMLLLIGAAVCHWFAGPSLAVALVGLAAASPFILYQWLMRRASYVHNEPQQAAIAGAGYCVVMISGLLALEHWKVLTIPSALAVMGGASLVVGIWLAYQEGVRSPWKLDKPLLKEAATEHGRYGRWAMASGLVGFVPAYVYYLILPLVANLQQSGALRALTNLVMPLLQANVALCILLLPRLVRCRGTPHFARTARNAMFILVGASTAYYLFIAIFHEPIRHLVYGDKFAEYSFLLWLIGLQPILTAATGVLDVVVASHERPDYVFYSCLASAIAAVTLGAGLTWQWGVAGVTVAVLINFLIHLIVIAILARKLLREQSDKPLTGTVPPLSELNAMIQE